MNLRSVFITLIALFVLSGCVNEIEFDPPRADGQIVVSGSIYDRPGPYRLQLGITTLNSTIPSPLNGAEITHFSGDGNSETYVDLGNGLYELPGTAITGKRGETYHIEILLPNGEIYQSLPETIPIVHSRDSVILEAEIIQEPTATGRIRDVPVISVYANTEIPDAAGPLYLQWSVYSIYSFVERTPTHPLAPPPETCYVTTIPDPQAIKIFSTTSPENQNIERQFMAQKNIVQHEFFIRHYFNVVSKSISQRRYQYWQQVDEMINQTGTIFDAPPATPPGNIVNINNDQVQALGYFEAVAIDTSRAFVTRADIPVSIFNPCSGFNQHPACDQCLLLENSTLDRPFYF